MRRIAGACDCWLLAVLAHCFAILQDLKTMIIYSCVLDRLCHRIILTYPVILAVPNIIAWKSTLVASSTHTAHALRALIQRGLAEPYASTRRTLRHDGSIAFVFFRVEK